VKTLAGFYQDRQAVGSAYDGPVAVHEAGTRLKQGAFTVRVSGFGPAQDVFPGVWREGGKGPVQGQGLHGKEAYMPAAAAASLLADKGFRVLIFDFPAELVDFFYQVVVVG
jgi:hypothetical protein